MHRTWIHVTAEACWFPQASSALKNETQTEKSFQSLIFKHNLFTCFESHKVCGFFFSNEIDRDKSTVTFFVQFVRDFKWTCVCLCAYKYIDLCSWTKYLPEKGVCLPKNYYRFIPSAEKLLALLKVVLSFWKELIAMVTSKEGNFLLYTHLYMFNILFFPKIRNKKMYGQLQ